MKQASPSVAIVGIGGIFPDAPELTTFWNNIRDAKSAAREVPDGRWQLPAETAFHPEQGRPDRVYSKRGCFIGSLPPLSDLTGLAVDPKLAGDLDPALTLLLHAGKRALDDGVTADLELSRVGVIIGNLALPSQKSAELSCAILGRTFQEKLLGPAGDEPIPHGLNRYVAGLPAGFLAAALGLGGGSFTLDAACASSLYAIKLACDELISCRADAMLTGGLSRPDPLYTQMGFSQLRALSKRGICAPFDATGDGLVVGEGAGIFLLKRLDDALAQGDRIYGVIRGIGLSNDVGGSLLAPLSDGQLRAMRAAYQKAGWNPQDIDLIECHATGTPVGDATEVTSLKELWGGAAGNGCVIGSVKSNIGHLLTAAGAAALTKVLLAMAEETLPPTANFATAPESFRLEESPFRVLKSPAPWRRRGDGVPRRAAVSAFGFGGINAHLLVEEWLPGQDRPAEPAPARRGGSVAVVGLDARFGRWQDLASFQTRVLGGDASARPSHPTDWWGAEESAWLQKEGLKGAPYAGFYLDRFGQATDQFRIPPKELEEMLPQQLLMLQSAAAAIADARVDRKENLRTGVFVGIALDLNSTNFAFRWSIASRARDWAAKLGLELSGSELEEWIEQLRDQSGPPLSANRTMGALGSVVASRVAREFRCGGPSFTISSEESSGLRALEAAVRQLQSEEIDRAVVGAVDLAGDLRAVIGQHLQRPYSTHGSVTPFDQSADGTVVGEGAASVILKRLEDAERDGDRIYAVINGIGAASGELLVPGADAYRNALERAYGDAGLTPDRVGLIEAHGSGAAAEDRMEATALASFFDDPAGSPDKRRSLAIASVKADIGHAGAASGLASLVRGCLALYQEIIPGARPAGHPAAKLSGSGALFLPSASRYWLRNRAEGARVAGVSALGVDGSVSHVVLSGYDSQGSRAESDRTAPLGSWDEYLFCVTGADRQELTDRLRELRETAEAKPAPDLGALSHDVLSGLKDQAAQPLAVSLVARSTDELANLCRQGERVVDADAAYADGILHPSLRDRLFFSATPIGSTGKIGFVYPGSSNHFAGMGMDLSARWPAIFRRQDGENQFHKDQFQPGWFWNGAPADSVHDNHLAVIFGQVATGCAVTDVVQSFGIRPNAVIGYSLGESAGLFSTRTWVERDLMLSRMKASTLFTRDLAGECRAAREAWGEPEGKEINWSIGVVDAPAREVRRAIKKTSRVYLLIVNTPEECVIGGDVKWVKHLVAMLDCNFFPLNGVTTVHCEVARQVATPYRDLHNFNTTPPAGVTFYSGAAGSAYQVNRRSAAESILAQAIEGIDYPKVIEAAYAEGVRYFLEMGPGGSCTRMIGRILAGRPHLARTACPPGTDANSAILRLLAHLVAERMPVDLEPLLAVAPARTLTVAPSKGIEFRTGGDAFSPTRPGQAQPEPSRPVASVASVASVEPTPVAAVMPAATAVPAEAVIEAPQIRRSIDTPVSTQPVPPVPPVVTKVSTPAAAASFAVASEVALPQMEQTIPFEAAQAAVSLSDQGVMLDSLIRDFAAAEAARRDAHEAYLRVCNGLSQSLADNLALQLSIQQQLSAAGIPIDTSTFVPGIGAPSPAPTAASEPAAGTVPAVASYPGALPALYDRDMCFEFAVGSVAKMLGSAFAEADSYPTRVRLPDAPLQLVDRIVVLEGEPKSMTSGRVVTQHDIHPGAWYLDGGRIPTCIAVEAGQADLFLSGYLGIDFITKGLAVYRLLDAVVTFHRELPGPCETINYDIRIERFFRQGETYLFRFHFEATVNGEPLLSMRNGCAGFFSQAELDAGKGIVRGVIDLRPRTGILPPGWQYLVPMERAAYGKEQLDLLRQGDLAGCFGPGFAGLGIRKPLTIPGGRMELVHRVMELVPDGGRCGLGFIRAEADIHPDDWFITCHFVDDRVMPGTLMYECCMHTLRIFLLRLGWVAEADGATWQPVPGVASQLCCRGQVLETTKVVTYEVTVRELGYRPEPYAIVDALMYSDGKPIVEITNMSARLTGTDHQALVELWSGKGASRQGFVAGAAPAAGVAYQQKPAIYTKQQILAYSNGNPSEGFGDRYKVFDRDRKIARLPGPPFQFMDRVTAVNGEPWVMAPGALAEAQYDIPVDEWYFAADRQPRMPFSVLLEAALQPCGWLAAYVGSALTSPVDISFRNLGGTAVQHRAVTPGSGTLTATAKLTKAATSGGMIIQEFDFCVSDRNGVVYEGETMFGFFAKEALANQVGIRDAAPHVPSAEEAARGRSLPYPEQRPFPEKSLRMIDRIELYVPDGGPAGLGYLKGTKQVDPQEWYFKAHFYEDPVTPGSLGLESFLQLMKFAAVDRWGWNEGDTVAAVALKQKHRWLYRGQVVPTNKEVTVVAWVTAVDDERKVLTAAGFLYVDGRAIYQMNDFTVQVERG